MDKKYREMWNSSLSTRSGYLKSSVIRELLKVTQYPEVISFAGGLPAPEFFPERAVEEACCYLIPREGRKILQYGATEGIPELKKFLRDKMRKYGVPAELENIQITSGSQQALDLIGKVFINKGDEILVTEPTYLGAIQAWRLYGPEFITAGMDEEGVIIKEVEEALEKHSIKFMYMLPNFHNPAGVTIPLERRKKLVELAEKHDVFIVEDDPYGELRYEGEDITPFISLKKERVIYLATFSKTLCPGFRLGWIVAPEFAMQKIIQAKQGADLHTSTFSQYIAADICQRGILKSHVEKLKKVYKKRRDIMLESLEKYFPENVEWTEPEGGLFLWVILPEGTDTKDIFEKAKENNVAFVPGYAFYPNNKGKNTMRLNFSNTAPEKTKEGIKRLGDLLKQEL